MTSLRTSTGIDSGGYLIRRESIVWRETAASSSIWRRSLRLPAPPTSASRAGDGAPDLPLIEMADEVPVSPPPVQAAQNHIQSGNTARFDVGETATKGHEASGSNLASRVSTMLSYRSADITARKGFPRCSRVRLSQDSFAESGSELPIFAASPSAPSRT